MKLRCTTLDFRCHEIFVPNKSMIFITEKNELLHDTKTWNCSINYWFALICALILKGIIFIYSLMEWSNITTYLRCRGCFSCELNLKEANALLNIHWTTPMPCLFLYLMHIPLNKFPMDLPSTHVWAHIDLEIYGLYYHCLQLDTISIDA